MMSASRRLYVEGSDERHALYHFLARRGLSGLCEVEDAGGYENLVRVLPVYIKGTGVERLGVVVDADLDCAAKWQSLRNALEKSGYTNLPVTLPPDGLTISAPSLPQLGVWCMPDNNCAGALEEFIAMLVEPGDAMLARARKSVDAIKLEQRRFKPTYKTKAIIHTWLAWQEEPGTPMGQAITKRSLNADTPVAEKFATWLQAVFA